MSRFSALIHSDKPIQEVVTGCCDHHDLVADHVACASSFTLDSSNHTLFPPQRYAIVVLTDKANVQRGILGTDALVTTLLNHFKRLMCEAFGEDNFNGAVMRGMMEQMGLLVDDDEEEDETGDEAPVLH